MSEKNIAPLGMRLSKVYPTDLQFVSLPIMDIDHSGPFTPLVGAYPLVVSDLLILNFSMKVLPTHRTTIYPIYKKAHLHVFGLTQKKKVPKIN